ncbi:MAG: hypothetical protein A3G18_05265 [Rhodospirillales bacterium RIFCSPLOWO2_12_FULL_58_28]|nr:MAG: hypothetical protein A3H92_05360 [Rhodospirillales bacterium RIFCSPLOWO2_02_FULL_58_16]OHC78315.1 MAG: hypothetical protein A3G18_05265 [Rhodospirillales bacterium RIFCSPLOWO2_12_FULL_58_28]
MTNNSDFYSGFADVAAGDAAGSQLRGWAALATASLATAGIFALLLALSRIPGVEGVFPWPLDFFHKGLVIHVVFSFVVWFLSVFGGLLHLAALKISGGAPRSDNLGKAAVAGTALSCVLLFVPAFLDRGEASLNNYVPVIINPLYYAGVAALAISIGLAALRLLVNLAGRAGPLEPVCFGIVCAAVIYLAALACGAFALGSLWGTEASHAFNEDLFWGGGHLLQFVNVSLLLTAWYMLGRLSIGNVIGDGAYRASLMLLAPAAPAAIMLYFIFEAFSAEQTIAFTNLQYALAPPTLLAAVAGLFGTLGIRRKGRAFPWKEPAFLALVLSPLVFGAGGMLGLFVDGADTRTPAHYHGVIAGINLAFMGLFYALFLPLLGRTVKRGKALSAQFYLFGGGQFFACIGLFLAGGYGAPRKTAGAAQGLEAFWAVVGMYMNGVGALVAVIGGVMFIWTVAAALLRKPAP